MIDGPSDFLEEEDIPTSLERMTLPFVVEDDLAEPLDSFIVIRILFGELVHQETLTELEQVLDEWLFTNRAVALQLGLEDPVGETVQVGPQSVEFQIFGALGDPDSVLRSMLDRLASLSQSKQQILRVEMD